MKKFFALFAFCFSFGLLSAQTDLIDITGKWLHVDGSAVAPEGIEFRLERVEVVSSSLALELDAV